MHPSILNYCCYYEDKGEDIVLLVDLHTVDRNDCQCGRDIQWHEDKGLDVNLKTERFKWHPKTHTEHMPCDSFGEIVFRGFGSQSRNSPVCAVRCMCVCVCF